MTDDAKSLDLMTWSELKVEMNRRSNWRMKQPGGGLAVTPHDKMIEPFVLLGTDEMALLRAALHRMRIADSGPVAE